jgi:hypothetical protein
VCDSPAAPSFEEAVARFKDDLRAQGTPEGVVAMMPSELTISFQVSQTDEDRNEIVRLRRLADEAAAPYEEVIVELGQQHERELPTTTAAPYEEVIVELGQQHERELPTTTSRSRRPSAARPRAASRTSLSRSRSSPPASGSPTTRSTTAPRTS